MQELLRKIRQILRDKKKRRAFTRTVSSVAAIVVFVTTYALILPAITLEKTAVCGIEEHQHIDSCYEERLICGQEESDGHHHSDSCCTTVRELTCRIQEHRHSEDNGCFDADGNLICQLQEHIHDDSCYKEVSALTCGLEESEGHHHTDACYEKVLVCGKESHTHSENCYADSGSADTDAEADSGSSTTGASVSMPSEQLGSGDSAKPVDADNTVNTAPGTSDPDAAAEGEQPAAYVPELEPLDMESVLNSHTDLYYFHSEDGEEIPADSAEITDWKKVEKDTILVSTDLVRAYFAYSIPAGSLNETNPSARYRLPHNLHLSDQQIDAMNRYENGIAAGYRDSDAASGSDEKKTNKENYQKYLGAEAVEGDRRPDEVLKDGAREYISSVVRAENAYDDKGQFLGQDLIFTFVPYSIDKNKSTYDTDGTLISAGEKITGWFACDFRLDQIDWEQNKNNQENKNNDNPEKSEDPEKTADVIFVRENQKKEIREISRLLRMTDGNNEIEENEKIDETEEIKEIAETDEAFKPGTLTSEGDDYTITLDYSQEARIPENASLSVHEITAETDKEAYEACLEQASQQVSADDKSAVDRHATRFFDIEIVTTVKGEDGTEKNVKIEPSAPVSVQIQFDNKPASQESKPELGDPTVLHFAEEGVEKIDSTVTDTVTDGKKGQDNSQKDSKDKGQENSRKDSKDKGQEISQKNDQKDNQVNSTEEQKREIRFEAESFSIYGVIYTVDLRFEVNGKNYLITVTYGPEAQIPQDAELAVDEITEGLSAHGKSYEDYVTYTESALGMEEGSSQYIRLFEISIMKDGQKIQPAEGSSVDVRIELADSSSESLNVVHFADDSEEGENVLCSTENGENGSVVEFLAESFSVYSIVDAPERVQESVNTLKEIEENQEYYISIARNGTNYMTSTRKENNGTFELIGETDQTHGEKWFFEFPDTGKVNIYYLDSNGTKMYLNVDTSRNISFSETPQALSIEQTTNNAGTFYIYTVIENKNWALSVRSNHNFFFEQRNNGVNANERVVITRNMNDPYDLDGKTFGIAYNDDTASAAAIMAESAGGNRLQGLDLLIRTDVLNNKGNLLVAENSDIQEWTFEAAAAGKYYIKTTVDGQEKYLCISNKNVTLVDNAASASAIKAEPGTGEYSGKWHFTVGNYSLNYAGSSANNFNAVNNNSASSWLNLVEKSTLSDDDFVQYSARKISASDDILSATEKDDNGDILIDDQGNPVYRAEKTKVVIYTRIWNETTKKYEFYAVDHDGSLVRVYDSGDQINWIGNKVNSALWEFTEYTNNDGTPSYFYELENTAYAGKYLASQSESIISSQPVGINLNGRREGFDYTSIVAWDDDAYAYSGLKIEQGEDGSLRAVTCPLDEAADFHFAVIKPEVEETDPVTTVPTVDNNEYGISIKMINFNNKITGGRDSEQTAYLGSKTWDSAHAYEAEKGLVSDYLTGGYPTVTANTQHHGDSLSGLFDKMTPANHLFIQSVYNESGYFEYDSTQNFAHLNNDGNFTVYDQIGAIGTLTGPTRVHGQFMPYNDISAETGYAYDIEGNLITNQRNIRGDELPDSDPRKGEPLYSIPQNEADYYFGMELSAVFTQTPDGVDNWGHDIIFEFTGDDDFWFYVDGELVLDLGGVHSALGGSVNFRTGEVNCNGEQTTLYEIFKKHYQDRHEDLSRLDEIFVTKEVNGETVKVFSDYTTHEMKMFYMERGAGASNLKMRFNLASVKPGTVELSKQLKGIDNASNKLIQYPYQIWYQTAEYAKNEDGTYRLDDNGNRIILDYHNPQRLVQPPANTNLTGKVYAVYKGTKKLIPYKDSMTIGGITYENVFLLKAGETAVINFPEDTYQYKIVECGVDTAVYDHVYINGDQSDNEIFGKPYENTDGRNPVTGEDNPPETNTPYTGTTRSDFGIKYDTTQGRPRVEYTNEVPPEVMRTLTFEKVLYDETGKRLTDEEAAQITSLFSFRLYLGNEFADQENLLPADMYTYYIKGPDHNYCKWDKANKKFVSLGVASFEDFKELSKADRDAGTFTTSMYGSISKIPAGYTVEVRDLIVGTKYKLDEPDREIPKGYTRHESNGYVRTDLADGPVVYYTEEGTYGRHPAEGNTTPAEPISDTIADKTESANIEVRNQEGWGLTAKKEWTDKDFIIHDPIYLAVYLDDGTGNPGELVEGTVRMLNTNETEVYWFFPDLKIGDKIYNFNQFIVREVELTGNPTVDDNGVVAGYTGITSIDDGGSISVKGKTYSDTERTENYTVDYQKGDPTGKNENIRIDTVTNSRPGIQIYKTDWDGQNYLSGAEFTLKDSNGHDVGHASYTSDTKGLVTTAYLNEGTFTLNEIKTPFGYTALDDPITITVTTTQPSRYDLTVTSGSTTYYISLSGPSGFYTTAEATETDMARITVKNRTVRELQIIKEGVDGSTRIPLSDVHFALFEQVKDSEGHERPAYNPMTGYEDLVTNAEGVLEGLNMTVGAGTYYLREKAAPSGYKLLPEDLCFTIGANGTVKINNAGYTNWLTRNTSVSGTVSYKITIENTPLGITVRKTDENGHGLTGSKFVLCRKNDAGSFVIVTDYGLEPDGVINLTDTTEMTFSGMSNGIYLLTETQTPPGHIITTRETYFKVADGAVTLTDADGNAQTYTDVSLHDDNTTIAVKNYAGPALPNTGGHGTKLFYLLGGILILFGLSWRLSRGRFR